jgi:hypothetical protein
MVIVDAQVDNFQNAYALSGNFTFPTTVSQNQFVVIGGQTTRISDTVFEGDEISSGRVQVIDSVAPGELSVTITPTVIGYDVPDRSVTFTGTKTDSIGALPAPAGTDDYRLDYVHVREILETDGFFLRNGAHVFVAEAFYQDRLTGEILKVGHLVEGVDLNIFTNPFGLFRNAVFKGDFPDQNTAPVAVGEAIVTARETSVVFDALVNDSDPDGHAIRIDGLVQPKHGKVFDLGDGRLRYAPDLDHTGSDQFAYWVTDGYGEFTKAHVTVDIRDAAPGTIFGTEQADQLNGDRSGQKIVGLGAADVIQGRGGDDKLFGGRGADRISDGSGNDKITGGGASDRLIFVDDGERDVVFDFADGVDLLDLSRIASVSDMGDLSVRQRADGAVVIAYGDAEDRIVLRTDQTGLTAGDIDASDFIFAV